MGIDSVTETFFIEKPKPPVTQIPVALTRSFPTCNMINSQHHKLSPEKMFVLKGVIVTENDLGARKNGGDFFVLGKRLGRPQIFIFMLQLTVILWFFWYLHNFNDFFTGGNDFWETPDF